MLLVITNVNIHPSRSCRRYCPSLHLSTGFHSQEIQFTGHPSMASWIFDSGAPIGSYTSAKSASFILNTSGTVSTQRRQLIHTSWSTKGFPGISYTPHPKFFKNPSINVIVIRQKLASSPMV